MAKHTKGLLRGEKFNRRHSTVIDDAVPILRKAKLFSEVTKIVLSEIDPCHPGDPHLRFNPIPAGLKLMVRGRTAVQIFFVYTAHPAVTQRKIEAEWEELNR